MSNTEPVPSPKWNGVAGELAIMVPRGEPARTNLQMEQAVAKQVSDYLLHYGRRRISDVLVALTTHRIAQDLLGPGEDQAQVSLSREALMIYVSTAREQLKEMAN